MKESIMKQSNRVDFRTINWLLAAVLTVSLGLAGFVAAQETPASKRAERQNAKKGDAGKMDAAKKDAARPARAKVPWVTPALPDGKTVVTDTSPQFLQVSGSINPDVIVAKTPPTVDFLIYPGQDYEGKPWSNWGDGTVFNGKFYSSFGDHLALGAKGATADTENAGTAYVFEYDPATKELKLLVDVAKFLDMPPGHYTPGKIHGRIDAGSDGWLYFSTHRGSGVASTPKYNYKGDWIIRTNPATGQTEVVAQGPVANHCIPNSMLDPDRLIFYGGTAAGEGGEEDGVQFFAYDLKNRKMIYSGDDGPSRYMMFAPSNGRLYYTPGREGKALAQLMRFHPDENGGKPVAVAGKQIGIRASTPETPDGFIYTVSQGGRGAAASTLFRFNTKTEQVETLGPIAAGQQAYIASIEMDPTGRYLYYTAGAHGGGERDGTPIVQYDTKNGQKKIIAFLHPFYREKYGVTLTGSFGLGIDEKGETLYVTWNMARGGNWDSVGMTAIHIPESERPLD
jgi:hypothetical protein